MRRGTPPLAWGAFAFVVAVLGGLSSARAQPGADKLTIGAVVAAAGDQPTHIVFVHGIRTDARGASFPLQNQICGHIAGGCSGVRRVSTDVLSITPPNNATFGGQPIWSTNEEWLASRPIVDHYVYERPHGGPVIVDEVNWWPIAFPIKCRILVATDARLAGVDSRTLALCAAKSGSASGSAALGPEYHDWIDTPSEPNAYEAILAQRPDGGGAPWANRLLKTEILDWGLSDAVMALGTTKAQLRDTIRCALQTIAAFDPHRGVVQNAAVPLTTPPLFQSPNEVDCKSQPGAEQPAHYVIVSHSLGSFILLDTFAAATGSLRAIDVYEGRRPATSALASGPQALAEEKSLASELCPPEAMGGRAPMVSPAAVSESVAATRDRYRGLCLVASNSSSLYFLANQVPLLEIARIEEGLSDGKPKDTLAAWSQLVSDRQERPLQIIAFNDPGDVLTFETIRISGATVDNRTVRNAFRWFGVFERPDLAHTNYFTNKYVLKTMFGS